MSDIKFILEQRDEIKYHEETDRKRLVLDTIKGLFQFPNQVVTIEDLMEILMAAELLDTFDAAPDRVFKSKKEEKGNE